MLNRSNKILALPSGDDPLLTVQEVARQLRVDPTTVRRWIKGGQLPAVILPHRGRRESYRIKTSALAHIVEE